MAFEQLVSLNDVCRKANIKLVVCQAVGGDVGFVFNDFLTRHEVTDKDGLTYKQVTDKY